MRVVEIWRYPVKAMVGERLTRARLDGKIIGDHDWGVFDIASGKLLSGKTVPELLAMRAWVDGDTIVEIDGVTVVAGSAAANRTLADRLGRAVELRRPGAEASTIDVDLDDGEGDGPRGIDSFQSPPGALFDSKSTLHVISTATLAALEAAHAGWGDVRRYRPNILVDGSGEDAWVGSDVVIGTVRSHVRKRTERCVVPSRAQPGVDGDRALLRHLKASHDMRLGVYLDPRGPGDIAIGDVVANGNPSRP